MKIERKRVNKRGEQKEGATTGVRDREGKPSQGGRGSRGGGRMRLTRNEMPSLVKAPDRLKKAAKAGRERLGSPSIAGDQHGLIKSGMAEVRMWRCEV